MLVIGIVIIGIVLFKYFRVVFIFVWVIVRVVFCSIFNWGVYLIIRGFFVKLGRDFGVVEFFREIINWVFNFL